VETARKLRPTAAGVRRLVSQAGGGRLIGAGMLDATGTGLIIPLSVLFFVVHVGLPARLVGAGMSIGGALSMALTPLGGHLVDRFGSKRALICAWLGGCVAVACYVLVHSWLEIIVVIAALGFTGNVSGTARSTLVAAIVEPAEIPRVMAIQRSFRNVGYGLGGVLATAALATGGTGFLLAVLVDAASFVLAALLVSGMRVAGAAHRIPVSQADRVTLLTVLTDRRYLAVTVLDSLTTFHQIALQVALPLWVVLYTHAPRACVGLLFTLNTVVVVVAQVRVSRDVRRLDDAPRTYARGALAMIGAAVAFIVAHYVGAVVAVALLAVGAVLMTGAEMYCSAADWVVSFGLADENHRGKYIAVFSMGSSLGQSLGPSTTTALMSIGALPAWPVIAAIVACGSLGSGAIARSVIRQSGLAEPEPALS
jgi:MFS family permease